MIAAVAMATDDLDFDKHGAALHRGAALCVLGDLGATLAVVATDTAGVRLHDLPGLTDLLSSVPIQSIVAARLGDAAFPVRALLFDKTPATSWSLGWHQDRTIVVREQQNVAGFANWTVKSGLLHVEPPASVSARVLTIRVHLDNVPSDNAPLLIVPGSHCRGRIPEGAIASIVSQGPVVECIADRGDIWAYATPILHASTASAAHHHHRRVLHVDYAIDPLPGGLAWRGV